MSIVHHTHAVLVLLPYSSQVSVTGYRLRGGARTVLCTHKSPLDVERQRAEAKARGERGSGAKGRQTEAWKGARRDRRRQEPEARPGGIEYVDPN